MTVVAAAITPIRFHESANNSRRKRGIRMIGINSNPAIAPRQKAAASGAAAAQRIKMAEEETARTAGNSADRARFS